NHVGETIIDLGKIDIFWSEASHPIRGLAARTGGGVRHIIAFEPAGEIVVRSEAFHEDRVLLQVTGALTRGDDDGTRSVAAQAAVKETKGSDDHAGVEIVLPRQRFVH